MSDTPKTDKAAFVADCWQSHVPVKFAENLELECNDLRAIFPRILEALDSGACASTCSVDFLREIPREVKLVRQRLERELVEAADDKSRLADMAMDFRGQRDDLRNELNDTIRSCHIWQQGHSKIVADRDYWKAEAERWRDCHHEIIADRDWLILELVEIFSTADNCENTWDALEKISVIAYNILNGRPLP